MSRPIVIAYHLIWTAYGCWLPNDPRGSGSSFVHSSTVFELGDLQKRRKPVKPNSREIRDFYTAAEGKLKHPVQTFGPKEIDVIAAAIEQLIEANKYRCYACALMPDHVHIVIRKHKHIAEDMIYNVQTETRTALHLANLRTPRHPVWGGPGWKVYLDTPDDIRRTIGYVEMNPVKVGAPKQEWKFVKSYDGWPLHPGNNPNSPYARRFRGET